MRLAAKEEQSELREFALSNLENCLYIYLNLSKYEMGNNMKVWRNCEGDLRTIIMKYHDSLQVYSKGLNEEKREFLNLLNREKVHMISGSRELMEPLVPELDGEYEISYGMVYEITHFPKFERPDGFAVAQEGDMEEMAAFVCEDHDVGSHYNVKDLSNQYIERYQMKMGRNYYVKSDDTLQAHIATYAEDDVMAITSGMYARKDAYPFGCGTILEGCLMNDLLEEGKRVFTFVTSAKRKKYLNIMDADVCGDYMKLVRL